MVSSRENITATIRGKVVIPEGNDGAKSGNAPNKRQFQSDVGNVEIALNGGERITLSTISGDFAFFEVPPGKKSY